MIDQRQEEIGSGQGVYNGRKPTARAKADEVCKTHVEGKTPTEISEALGIGRGSVYRAIEAVGTV